MVEDNFCFENQDDEMSKIGSQMMSESREFGYAARTPEQASEIKFMSANRFLSRANQFIIRINVRSALG